MKVQSKEVCDGSLEVHFEDVTELGFEGLLNGGGLAEVDEIFDKEAKIEGWFARDESAGKDAQGVGEWFKTKA